MPGQSQSTPSGLKSHTGFWLRFVSNHVSYSFARRLLAHEVTVAEWVVLREMFSQPETSPSFLAEAIGLTRGAVSKLVERLVEKKLITRRESPDDRRYQTIALTPSGRRLVPRLAAIADENDAAFFSILSAGEQKTLLATLQKLVQAHGLTRIPTE